MILIRLLRLLHILCVSLDPRQTYSSAPYSLLHFGFSSASSSAPYSVLHFGSSSGFFVCFLFSASLWILVRLLRLLLFSASLWISILRCLEDALPWAPIPPLTAYQVRSYPTPMPCSVPFPSSHDRRYSTSFRTANPHVTGVHATAPSYYDPSILRSLHTTRYEAFIPPDL